MAAGEGADGFGLGAVSLPTRGPHLQRWHVTYFHVAATMYLTRSHKQEERFALPPGLGDVVHHGMKAVGGRQSVSVHSQEPAS